MSNNYKFIVTLPGYDADNATPEQCVVHSDYPCPKIDLRPDNPKMFGTVTVVPPIDTDTGIVVTVPHNLGYVPMIIVQANWVSGRYTPLPTSLSSAVFLYAEADDAELRIYFAWAYGIDINAQLAGMTFKFKYYIFVENGA